MNSAALRRAMAGVAAIAVLPLLPPGHGSMNAAPVADAAGVTPFTIRIPDADLRDLHDRLAQARFADEIPGAGPRPEDERVLEPVALTSEVAGAPGA